MSNGKEKEAACSPVREPLMAPPPYDQAVLPRDDASSCPPYVNLAPPINSPPGIVYQYMTPIEVTQSEAPDHMLMAILATIFCCMPLGVVAIFKAAECKAQRARGNREAALKNSASARRYSLWAFGVGFVFFILIVVLYGIHMANFIRRVRELNERPH